jgi:hypothetical protein
MRTLIAIALSSTLLASAALAAESAPLSAGHPAGVKQAQEIGTSSFVLIGIGVVTAIAIGVASSSNGSPVGQTPPLAVTTTTI